MSAPKVGFLTIVRGTFDTNYGTVIREQIKVQLSQYVDVVDVPAPVATASDAVAALNNLPMSDLDALVVLQATFADGSVITEIAQTSQLGVVVWGIPEPPAEPGVTPRLALNSLCGINLAAHSLHRISAPHACVFGMPDPGTVSKVVRNVRAFAATHRLQKAKILALGRAPNGFYPSDYDADEIRRKFGIEVNAMSLDEVFSRATAVPQAAVAEFSGNLAKVLPGFSAVPKDQVEKSVRAYLAVKDYITHEGITAVAAECWPRFMTEYGGAACFMLSRLNDEGYAAACETDVHGAITMLLQHQLTGTASFFADLVQIDKEANTGVFWHCGAGPTTLAGSGGAQAGVQPNRKVGLAFNFALKEGRVTIAKIGRSHRGYTMFIATGTAVTTPLRFLGNTLTVHFDSQVEDIMETILTKGLDHHYAVAFGDIAGEMRSCATSLGIDVVEVGARCDIQ